MGFLHPLLQLVNRLVEMVFAIGSRAGCNVTSRLIPITTAWTNILNVRIEMRQMLIITAEMSDVLGEPIPEGFWITSENWSDSVPIHHWVQPMGEQFALMKNMTSRVVTPMCLYFLSKWTSASHLQLSFSYGVNRCHDRNSSLCPNTWMHSTSNGFL